MNKNEIFSIVLVAILGIWLQGLAFYGDKAPDVVRFIALFFGDVCLILTGASIVVEILHRRYSAKLQK